MSNDFWPPIPPNIRFLPSNDQFLGVISDPPSPLKSDIINGHSLRDFFLFENICLSIIRSYNWKKSRWTGLNTSYLTDSYISFTLKLESRQKNCFNSWIRSRGQVHMVNKIFVIFFNAGRWLFLLLNLWFSSKLVSKMN